MQPNKEAIRCFLYELYIKSDNNLSLKIKDVQIFKRQWAVILFQEQLLGF